MSPIVWRKCEEQRNLDLQLVERKQKQKKKQKQKLTKTSIKKI